jgi:hypothetical protein
VILFAQPRPLPRMRTGKTSANLPGSCALVKDASQRRRADRRRLPAVERLNARGLLG